MKPLKSRTWRNAGQRPSAEAALQEHIAHESLYRGGYRRVRTVASSLQPQSSASEDSVGPRADRGRSEQVKKCLRPAWDVAEDFAREHVGTAGKKGQVQLSAKLFGMFIRHRQLDQSPFSVFR